MLTNSALDPVFECLIVAGWFEREHRFLQPLWESLEVFSAYHARLFVVSGQFGQLLELGGVFVQLSSLHSELEELLLGPFSAHNILEILGKIVDHSIPDPFVGISPSRPHMAVQSRGYLLDPEVHLWSPKVSKE